MFALRAPRVFDGQGFLPDGATVLIDAGRIVGMESAHHAPPDRCELIEYDDATILPGLVEAHVHLVADGGVAALDRVAGYTEDEIDAVVTRSLRRQLDAGVTTVRDLGDRHFCVVDRRDARRYDPADEPTIVASGPPITSRGGHCFYMGGEVSGEAEIVSAVSSRADRRVDVVKVMASGGANTPSSDLMRPQFTAAEMALIVEEAHAAGLPVTAHAHAPEAVELAVEAGVDCLEHASFIRPPEGRLLPGAPLPTASDEELDRVAASGIPVCPTVGGLSYLLSQMPRAHLQALLDKYGVTPEALVESRWSLLTRMHEHGIRFVSGADAGIGPNKAHGDYRLAISDLAQLLPVDETLASATSSAAEVCRLGGTKGRLKAGYDADLLVCAGDVGRDVGMVGDVRAVFLAGRRVR